MSFSIIKNEYNFNPESNPIIFRNANYVGVGTRNPVSKIDITGSISACNNIFDSNDKSGDDYNVLIKVNNDLLWSYQQYTFKGYNMFIQNSITNTTPALPLSGSRPLHHPCLAPNGKIYSMPYGGSPYYCIINTYNDTVTLKTSLLGTSSSGGSVCAYNGKIYSPSFSVANIRVIDTINGDNEYLLTCERGGWFGCCLSTNGKIYCVPADFYVVDGPKVMVIDPRNDSITYITVSGINYPVTDSLTGGIGNACGDDVWYGGILAPNGKIYCMPSRGTSILVIDPFTESAQCDIPGLDGFATSTSPGGQAGKFSSGVLASNGKIYGLPYVATSNVIQIDPTTNTYITTSISISGGRKCIGGTLGIDGKIYCSTDNAGTLAIINVDNLTSTTITSTRGNGTCLAPNGKIYIMPNLSGGGPCIVKSISTGIPTKESWMLAPEFNKY